MDILNLMGWLSTICFSACALPEVLYAYKHKRCNLTWGLLILWLAGEVLVIIPIAIENPIPYLLVNYTINIAFLVYLVSIKLKQAPPERTANLGKSNPTQGGGNTANL